MPSGPTSSTASPALEAALDSRDAHGEQAGAVALERAARPGVDVQPTGDGLAVQQPELERGRRAIAGLEARAARLAGDDRREHVLAGARSDHRRDPGRGGKLGGQHLARHAALAERRPAPSSAAAACEPAGEQLRAGQARRARVDAVDLRQQHEQPRADEDRRPARRARRCRRT